MSSFVKLVDPGQMPAMEWRIAQKVRDLLMGAGALRFDQLFKRVELAVECRITSPLLEKFLAIPLVSLSLLNSRQQLVDELLEAAREVRHRDRPLHLNHGQVGLMSQSPCAMSSYL